MKGHHICIGRFSRREQKNVGVCVSIVMVSESSWEKRSTFVVLCRFDFCIALWIRFDVGISSPSGWHASNFSSAIAYHPTDECSHPRSLTPDCRSLLLITTSHEE
jgi:hypothetical protein